MDKSPTVCRIVTGSNAARLTARESEASINADGETREGMSMTKKDFIALADTIRNFNELHENGSETANHFDTQQLAVLAAHFKANYPAFNRDRWLDYIAGKCGPNGGVR